MNLQDLFTTSELADLLGISPRTVYAWRKERGLPFFRVGPRLIRFNVDSVESWLESQGK